MEGDQNEEGAPDSQNNEALVLAEAVAIVDHSHQLLKKERQLRRLGRALQRLGITGITGGSWTHLEDLADLIKDQTQVPAPVTVGGVHIHHVGQLQINFLFGTQPPTTD